MYAVRVKEVYGEWPRELWFNKFREGILDREPFNIVTAQEDIDWFLRSIDDIYKARNFLPNLTVSFVTTYVLCVSIASIPANMLRRNISDGKDQGNFPRR